MTPRLKDHLRAATFGALRAGFRLLPLGQDRRDRLRQAFLGRFPQLVPAGPRGQQAAPGAAHRLRQRADLPAIGHVDARPQALPATLPATLVAFYLPQYHVIPENDAWWGKGFTEWRNVSRALPQFEGHAQPRLPADLGFYDLRNPQTLREQAQLAARYGIGAFCSYFYWFGGKTLLEAPLQQWLEDASITLPLCLCWANENWSRRWDGREQDLLISQRHSAEDDLAFIAHVARYLRDPRYLRVDGKPLLLVYRPGLLPDPAATAQRWRGWCRDNGIGELQLAYVQSFERPDPHAIGFDAAIEFPPNLATPADLGANQRLLNPDYRGQVLDWRQLAREYLARPQPDYLLYPGVNCGWDNEPRRPGAGRTYLHASPRGYRDWLRRTVFERLKGRAPAQRLVFINAWNEWAEGAVLEPDARLGHAWLQATADALHPPSEPPKRPCLLIHAWYPEVLGELLDQARDSGLPFRIVISTAPEKAAAVRAAVAAAGTAAEIVEYENRGRDLLPFLQLAERLLGEGEDVVLKLHTKRSDHRGDGAQWRQELVQRLLAPERAQAIARAFAEQPRLGMVAAEGHLQPLDFYWGANADNVQRLLVRCGLPPADSARDSFVAGSMCWLRLEALRPLLDAHLSPESFETEQGQVDGTVAHALERCLLLAARHAGFETIDAARLLGLPEPDGQPYPYARRG